MKTVNETTNQTLNEKEPTTFYTKVSMNLNQRSIENVNRLCELIGENNKTRIVSISLELSRTILEMKQKGEKFFVRNGRLEKEMLIL